MCSATYEKPDPQRRFSTFRQKESPSFSRWKRFSCKYGHSGTLFAHFPAKNGHTKRGFYCSVKNIFHFSFLFFTKKSGQTYVNLPQRSRSNVLLEKSIKLETSISNFYGSVCVIKGFYYLEENYSYFLCSPLFRCLVSCIFLAKNENVC